MAQKRLLERSIDNTEGVPEAVVAEVVPLGSVQSLLAEVAPGSLEAVTNETAGPPSSRRFAAELSHLALLKRKKQISGAVVEAPQIDTPLSLTLEHALIESGRGDLLAALR